MKFSVLISVYIKEKPHYLDEALASIERQTLQPNEVVIVEDGPLTDGLHEVISDWAKKLPIKSVKLPENVGLGRALAEGVKACKYDLIARMDGDDICVPERFDEQIEFMGSHDDIAVLGGAILEFDNDETNPYALRKTPTEHCELLEYAKRRNPLNHVTVVFRKHAVLAVGNYVALQGFEDYYLWIRLFEKGFKGANLEKPLVLVRTGKEMLRRRGGFTYIWKEIEFFRTLNHMGYISYLEFLRNIVIRSIVRLSPVAFRRFVYKFFIRKRV